MSKNMVTLQQPAIVLVQNWTKKLPYFTECVKHWVQIVVCLSVVSDKALTGFYKDGPGSYGCTSLLNRECMGLFTFRLWYNMSFPSVHCIPLSICLTDFDTPLLLIVVAVCSIKCRVCWGWKRVKIYPNQYYQWFTIAAQLHPYFKQHIYNIWILTLCHCPEMLLTVFWLPIKVSLMHLFMLTLTQRHKNPKS